MPPSGDKLPKCWKMHCRATHVIFMHLKGFSTFRRGCVASQHVAGPIFSRDDHCCSGSMKYLILCRILSHKSKDRITKANLYAENCRTINT